MTARIDMFVQAAGPKPVDPLARPAAGPHRAAEGKGADPAAAEARTRAQAEGEARWKAITEAGGIDAWVKAQLQAKGLDMSGVDPSTLSDRERGQYKGKKKAEAEERRALRRQAWAAYRATHILHLGPNVHWEDDPDRDRFDIDDRERRAQDNGLAEWSTPEALARGLGLSIPRLRWLTYHREVDGCSHYKAFTIPKRDGSPRLIWAPKRDLKSAQRWVLRQVAEKLPVHSAAHGFMPQRSIVTNAAAHAGADVIVKLDIEGFFPTVTWKRVKGLLRKAGLSEQVATLLSLLCTESPREVVSFRGQTLYVASGPRVLPQGAPTSPALTNALCMRLDRRLSGLARTMGFRYTRYADDLTFSWRRPDAAAQGGAIQAAAEKARAAGLRDHQQPGVGALVHGARAILLAEGFRLNEKKTRVLRAGSRQKITGLVVNEVAAGVPAARVPRDVLRRLRAALHNREKGRAGKPDETLAQLQGMAAFVYMTDRKRGQELLDRIKVLSEGGSTVEAPPGGALRSPGK